MLKILTTEQMRAADAATIKNEPIASIDLMERAAKACVDWLLEEGAEELLVGADPGQWLVTVVAGPGNNGGDGLAMARMLAEHHVKVSVLLLELGGDPSNDHLTNLKRLGSTNVPLIRISSFEEMHSLEDQDLIIDAVFGTGLTRPVEGWLAKVFRTINKWAVPVLSIDLPSGMFSERNEEIHPGGIIQADRTLVFQQPRLSLVLPDAGEYAGAWKLIDIGLDEAQIGSCLSLHYLTEEQDVQALLRERPWFAHKGTFGHALLMAGGHGKMGAAVLAARSCLRSGVGLVTVAVPPQGLGIIQTAVPEAMAIPLGEGHQLSGTLPLSDFRAVGVGPGIGQDEATATMLKVLIQEADRPIIFDADALNILAENKTWLPFIPKGCILTPHPGEFDRLSGRSEHAFDRLEKARELAFRTGCIVVLKGAYTAICAPDRNVYFNTTGNPGMATGGSGDVLTGLLAGLLAQGYPALHAAMIGVYLHGLAGDLASTGLSMEGMIVGDLIDHLPMAWDMIQ